MINVTTERDSEKVQLLLIYTKSTTGFPTSLCPSLSTPRPVVPNVFFVPARLVFGDIARLIRWKSSCRPNFGQISRSMMRYYYFRFLKTNCHHTGILLLCRLLHIHSDRSRICKRAGSSIKLSVPRHQNPLIIFDRS